MVSKFIQMFSAHSAFLSVVFPEVLLKTSDLDFKIDQIRGTVNKEMLFHFFPQFDLIFEPNR